MKVHECIANDQLDLSLQFGQNIGRDLTTVVLDKYAFNQVANAGDEITAHGRPEEEWPKIPTDGSQQEEETAPEKSLHELACLVVTSERRDGGLSTMWRAPREPRFQQRSQWPDPMR